MSASTNSPEKFWVTKLHNLECLNLPSQAHLQSNGTASVYAAITGAQLAAITKIAGNSDFNVFKLFFTGLTIVLNKYSSQNDILISLPPLKESVAGSNTILPGTLYCRMTFDDSCTVNELLQKTHAVINEAHLNSIYDEALMMQLYGAENNGNYLAVKGAALFSPRVNAGGDWLDDHALVFELEEYNSAMRIKLTSRLQALPQQMLQNMADVLVHITATLAENKNQTLALCTALMPGEVNQWKERFAAGRRNYPEDITVIDLFDREVQKNPENTALVYKGGTISYGELSALSLQIMEAIQATGNSSGVKAVALQLERSVHLVAAMIAVMRMGAAYVPLNTTFRTSKLMQTMADTGCTVILTDRDDVFPEAGCYAAINVTKLPASPIGLTGLRVPSPEDIAYIIYSSGTTGAQKGILIKHKALINLLYWYRERYALTAETRIIQLTDYTIDIAFQEIFSALICGGTLYIPSEEERRDKHLFYQYLVKHSINFIQVIPEVLAEYFLDMPRPAGLNLILCGGDKLSEPLKDRITEKGYTLFNIYGQTESTIDVVGAACTYGERMKFNEFVPNYEVWICDEHENLCPEYVSGEICVSGKGLAAGYNKQEELTARRFVAYPQAFGHWIYKTGDYGRRLPDGSIEFIGRKDDQLKIRGFRIDAGSIEETLLNYPGIEAAVVTAKYNTSQEKELVAYIVTSKPITSSALRSYLNNRFPSYMIPGYFVELPRLPVTPAGKTDKEALPDPQGIEMVSDTVYVAATNEVEECLVEIWKEVLEKDVVGINDNFFESGGNSIKIVKMVDLLNKKSNRKLSVVMAFTYTTIRELAAYINAENESQGNLQVNGRNDTQLINKTLMILNK